MTRPSPSGPLDLHYTEIELRRGATLAHCHTCGCTLPLAGTPSAPAVAHLLRAFQRLHPSAPAFPPYLPLGWQDGQAVAFDSAGQPHTAGELAATVALLQGQLLRLDSRRDPAAPLTRRALEAAIALRQVLVGELWALEWAHASREDTR